MPSIRLPELRETTFKLKTETNSYTRNKMYTPDRRRWSEKKTKILIGVQILRYVTWQSLRRPTFFFGGNRTDWMKDCEVNDKPITCAG